MSLIPKKMRKSICHELKLEILRRTDAGERQIDIGKDLKLAGSTIRTIIKNRDKILNGPTKVRLTKRLFNKRLSNTVVEMENMLTFWLEKRLRKNMPVTVVTLLQKSLEIYGELQMQDPDELSNEIFTPGERWLQMYKKKLEQAAKPLLNHVEFKR